MAIRPLSRDDLPTVLAVQRRCYRADVVEPLEAFERRLALFAAGCLGAEDAGALGGYVFGHPWTLGRIVPLGVALRSLPRQRDCFYIHDLAVLPEWRGRGVAARLVGAVVELAGNLGFERAALVAVQGSEPFWRRHGFRSVRSFEYAKRFPASYMVRSA
jgi:predicted N-acetyltransferase YhbS